MARDDYVDKAFAAIEKKAGQMTGHHIDPNNRKIRSANEKIVRIPSRLTQTVVTDDEFADGQVAADVREGNWQEGAE